MNTNLFVSGRLSITRRGLRMAQRHSGCDFLKGDDIQDMMRYVAHDLVNEGLVYSIGVLGTAWIFIRLY